MREAKGEKPADPRASPAAAVRWAEAYRRWRASTLGRITDRIERRLVFRLTGELAGARLLDVGCGDGTFALAAAERGAWIVGVDSSLEMLQAARAGAARRSLQAAWVLAEGARLPFRAGVFDRALVVTVLCTAARPMDMLREIARVLAKDGRCVVAELSSLSTWALWRKVKARLGSRLWRAVTFRSPWQLSTLVEGAGFSCVRAEGAIYYPPLGLAARALAWLDRWLGGLTLAGAAIVTMECIKKGDPRV